MDEFGTVSQSESSPVPDQLRGLFNNPDDVRVQKLPRAGLEDRGSMAVFFGAGARTVPHTHHHGQHLFISEGTGVVGDEKGVHVVRAGDVVSSPAGAWHWHGAAPGTAMTHLTVEKPGDFDLDVERRDWDTTYGPELDA
jgi:quercetin dioxygenase-like cupin family protein